VGAIKRYIAAIAALTVVGTAVILPASSVASRPGNVVQTAAAAGHFKTLIKLAKKAGLVKTLEGKGPFTVFAPTDAAFAKVPRATLTALEHNRSKLRAILLYHVVSGNVTVAKLAKLHFIKTLNGESLRVCAHHGTVRVNGVRVRKANVFASNGVIHVINRVLIPR
jgi:uncharacterized surface protein with fasciclin (FAS1) repeats